MGALSLVLAVLAVAASEAPGVLPLSCPGEPVVQLSGTTEGRAVLLRAVPGRAFSIRLAPGEQVKSVALGDSSAWQATVCNQGRGVSVTPLEEVPPTDMTLVTSLAAYSFTLETSADAGANVGASAGAGMDAEAAPAAPVAVAAAAAAAPPSNAEKRTRAAAARVSDYRLSGEWALRPDAISDDGAHTYIAWPANASIPAIYTIDSSGAERVANGAMGTDDVYVVEGVPQRLLFRMDGMSAAADRIPPRSRR